MEDVFVLYVINSIIGKRGNIGYRLNYIISDVSNGFTPYMVIARGDVTGNDNVFSMGVLGNLSRIINYLSKTYVNFLNGRKFDLLIFNAFFYLIYRLKIRNKVKKTKHKVVHLCESSSFIARYLKKEGFEIILDVPIANNGYVERILKTGKIDGLKYNGFMDRQEQFCYENADLIIVPSDFVKEQLLLSGVTSNKIKKVPFGFDSSRLIDSEKKSHVYQDANKIVKYCFAGNISFRKGISYLLEAWNDEVFKNDELHLCGKVYPEMKEKIKTAKYQNVYTPGFVDVYSYFSSCDVYVFPSLMEGSSKSIYEAMACGLPIITTYESGSLVEDGVEGIIIDVANINSIKQSMIKLKLDNKLRNSMGNAAQEKVAKYPWERYIFLVKDCYRDLNKSYGEIK